MKCRLLKLKLAFITILILMIIRQLWQTEFNKDVIQRHAGQSTIQFFWKEKSDMSRTIPINIK